MSNFFLGASTPSTTRGLSRSHSPYESRPVSPTTPTPFALPPSFSDNDGDDDDDGDLPFPQPLSRSEFSPLTAPTFSPHEFLASLHNRHQTLEDLRLELRNRSRDLERELVELVNNEYADFVGLGRSLGGGEGKVEDLRVGLWGVRREVEGLVGKMKVVEEDVKRGIEEKRRVWKEKAFVKELLGAGRRLDDIEMLLLLEKVDEGGSAGGGKSGQEKEKGDGDADGEIKGEQASFKAIPGYGHDDGGDGIGDVKRLEREVDAYLCLKHALGRLPPGTCESHPFMKTQMQRVERVRRTILLDLGTALRSVAVRGEEGLVLEGEEERRKGKVVGIMELFLSMGEGAEAVRILKEVGGGKGNIGKGSKRRGGGGVHKTRQTLYEI